MSTLSPSSSPVVWQPGFLALLPRIRRLVRFAFRNLEPERRAEAIQEALANALVAYLRLFQQRRTHVAFAGSLAKYAVRQVRCGRQVATPQNSNDVTSVVAQLRHKLHLISLDRRARDDDWKEVLIEDRRATPADLAASRIDFADWLDRMPHRRRQVAEMLARGESTLAAARKFNVTPGRISQLRRELERDWHRFQGEDSGSDQEHALAAC